MDTKEYRKNAETGEMEEITITPRPLADLRAQVAALNERKQSLIDMRTSRVIEVEAEYVQPLADLDVKIAEVEALIAKAAEVGVVEAVK